MKSPFALPAVLALLLVLPLALSACGQTGPLYMPKPPAKLPAKPAAGAVTATGANANATHATNPPSPAASQQ